MASTLTGAKPLPVHFRIQRFLLVGWNFLMVYLSYKRIQRNKKLVPAERERRYRRAHQQNAQRIYRLAIRMEGLMIKTCQFISSRADVAPPEYVSVLSRLQDKVPARSFPEVEGQILRELGQRPDEPRHAVGDGPGIVSMVEELRSRNTYECRVERLAGSDCLRPASAVRSGGLTSDELGDGPAIDHPAAIARRQGLSHAEPPTSNRAQNRR